MNVPVNAGGNSAKGSVRVVLTGAAAIADAVIATSCGGVVGAIAIRVFTG